PLRPAPALVPEPAPLLPAPALVPEPEAAPLLLPALLPALPPLAPELAPLPLEPALAAEPAPPPLEPEVCALADDSAIDSTISETDIFAMEIECRDIVHLARARATSASVLQIERTPAANRCALSVTLRACERRYKSQGGIVLSPDRRPGASSCLTLVPSPSRCPNQRCARAARRTSATCRSARPAKCAVRRSIARPRTSAISPSRSSACSIVTAKRSGHGPVC